MGKVNHTDHLTESRKKEAILVLNWVAAVSVPLRCSYLSQQRSKLLNEDFGYWNRFKKQNLEKNLERVI